MISLYYGAPSIDGYFAGDENSLNELITLVPYLPWVPNRENFREQVPGTERFVALLVDEVAPTEVIKLATVSSFSRTPFLGWRIQHP